MLPNVTFAHEDEFSIDVRIDGEFVGSIEVMPGELPWIDVEWRGESLDRASINVPAAENAVRRFVRRIVLLAAAAGGRDV
jgi:GH25 family lysozyme M1 (1,4-beta-N-acetylmuramidase)